MMKEFLEITEEHYKNGLLTEKQYKKIVESLNSQEGKNG